MQDDVRVRMPDVKFFELYMLGLETVCRDTVNDAIKSRRLEVDERWLKAVAESIEAQLLHHSFNRDKSQHLFIHTGYKKA